MIINVPWLQDILFHPVITIFHRALDSIQNGKPNLLAMAIFSSTKSPTKLTLRRWISLLIRKDFEENIEKYVNAHLNGELEHFGHKHWFTPNEWIRLLEACGLTILADTGSFVVPPGVKTYPRALTIFYRIEDILPSVVRKWLGRSFLIVASNQR